MRVAKSGELIAVIYQTAQHRRALASGGLSATAELVLYFA